MNDIKLRENFLNQIESIDYPCVMAKSALLGGNINIIIADAFCPAPSHVEKVLGQIYEAIDRIMLSTGGNHSIAVLFRTPEMISEEQYDAVFWPYLQCLNMLDSRNYGWDKRVSPDPASSNFSFSLKGESFYIIGMHNKSSRKARVSQVPAIIFNPHRQFESMREKGSYMKIRDNIRKRDIIYSGSRNPMLENFGDASEVLQYTGRKLDKESWKCPFSPVERESLQA